MALKEYINRLNKDLGEVDLFQEMMGYFNSKPYASVATGAVKTHHHNVDYIPFPPYYGAPNWGQKVTKEISDVFIVVFSEKRDLARMTHLQAKLETKHGLDRTAGSFVFGLDAGQYLMLHNRLQVHDSTGFFPDNMLSCPFYSDSVASYGVFYKEGNAYNMAYEIAPLITHPAPIFYASKKQYVDHNFATIQDIWGYYNIKYSGIPFYNLYPRQYHYELVSTIDIQTFECELYNVRVGTRVDFDIQMLRKIASLFIQKGVDINGLDAFIQKMISYWNEGLLGDPNNAERGDGIENMRFDFNIEEIGGTFLLINADKANNGE